MTGVQTCALPILDDLQDVGGGIRVASVLDPFGNAFGIIENPHFRLGG